MEKIRNDTLDISPELWEKFDLNNDNRELYYKVIKTTYSLDILDAEKFNTNIDIANFFDILIFLLRDIDRIFNDGLNNYLDILSIMCVYSSLVRELQNYEHQKELSHNLVEEFIDLFNNFENVLHREDLNKDDVHLEVNETIKKTNNLYLKVIQSI